MLLLYAIARREMWVTTSPQDWAAFTLIEPLPEKDYLFSLSGKEN